MSGSPAVTDDTKRHIVIIGGGIIGCTTAYYLTHHPAPPATVTAIESSAHGAAQGASGKAGGLVARWAYPEALARLSFSEHARLAEEHGGGQGICNAPGTARAVCELVVEGRVRCVDLSGLEPGRFL